jgi:hypothetical protein
MSYEFWRGTLFGILLVAIVRAVIGIAAEWRKDQTRGSS